MLSQLQIDYSCKMSKIENIPDSASGKLAELAKKSLSDHKSGKSTEL